MAGTILEQFGHSFIDLGACTLGTPIKDLYTCEWKKNLNSL